MGDHKVRTLTFRKVFTFILAFILIFNVAALGWVVLYRFLPIPVTKVMIKESQAFEIKYKWVDLDEIADPLELAVMCAEDQNFLLHFGLDFKSIEEAEARNMSESKVRGASTITQQVAKNAFLWPDRTYLRKGAELYFALLIEMIWSKERIMEVYLNVAEFGEGIFGAEAASQHYFNKAASKLTVHQSAQLAAILPSPKRYQVHQPGPYVQRRVQWIKRQMGYWGNEMTYDKAFLRKMLK